MTRLFVVPVLVAMAFGTGCAREDRTVTPASAPLARIGSGARLAKYLDLMVASRNYSDGFLGDTYMAPPGVYGDDSDTTYWVADHVVIDSAETTDSATVTAIVTTVARSVGDPSDGSWLSELRVRDDTVRWRLWNDSARGWVVVGSGTKAVSGEVFQPGKSGPRNRWRPPATSEASAVALIDSVRTARGHAAVR